MSDDNEVLAKARQYRDATLNKLTNSLNARNWQPGTPLTDDERQLTYEVDALNERLKDHERHAEASAAVTRRFGDPSTRTPMKNAPNLVYQKHGGASFVRDLAMATLNPASAYEARDRLTQHTEDMRYHPAFAEQRALSRTDGYGGYFSPPAWLIDEYAEFARAGRVFADLLSAHPLPGGVDVINVPKILTGTATAIQPADNTQVVEQDITDTFVSSPIRTIAGQQSLSIQLVDQSPVPMDDIILQDLTKSLAQQVDIQTLYGTGTSGQLQGIAYTAGINSVAVSEVTVQGLYNAIAQAVSLIWSQRFMEPTAVVLHPIRWAWLLSLLDSNNRPLFLPEANHPMNAAGIQGNVLPQGRVGTVMGLPIYTDANLSVTQGSGTGVGNQDSILVLRAEDIFLYESGIRARVLPEPLAQTLTLLVQVYEYAALGVRFPASIVEITGLTPPTW